MSLSAALSNAASGLAAASRAAGLVSENLANALTPGYVRRSLVRAEAVTGGLGAGVRIEGIVRHADPRATAGRRQAGAAEGEGAALAAASLGREGALGTAENALGARARAFAAALDRAGDSPESVPLQTGLLTAAQDLAKALNAASAENRRLRTEADATIARQVESVNTDLAGIVALNREIAVRNAAGEDVAALEDDRQRLIDGVNAIVPVTVARRQGDAVALYTPGGAVLLDGRAAVLGFTATGTITADMTLGSGALSPLTLDGTAVSVGQGGGKLDGGTLAAAFATRDAEGEAFDGRIDAIAEDLIERFEAVDTDAGGAGLLTDAGNPLDLAAIPGLAGRIAVNAAADPGQGGALWRLRDGLGAAAAGIAGDETLLRALADAWNAARPAPAASGLQGSPDAAALIDGVTALVGEAAGTAEEGAARQAALARVLREDELGATGVDSDAELRELLLVERSYAANARVIGTIDRLFRELLEI
jgi:flagellar hook-associated protein 1 FlgK